MKQLIKKTLFPRICINFTIVLLTASFLHILLKLAEYLFHGSTSFSSISITIIGYFVLLCLDTAADLFIEKMNFRDKKISLLAEAVLKYMVLFSIAFVFGWKAFNVEWMLCITGIFFIYYPYFYRRTYKKCKKKAAEINRLINGR